MQFYVQFAFFHAPQFGEVVRADRDALGSSGGAGGIAALGGQACALVTDGIQQDTGMGFVICRTKGGGVDGNDEFAVTRGEAAAAVGFAAFTAEQVAYPDGGQQFDHGGNGRAFVAAEGQQGSAVKDGSGVVAGFAVAVNAPAVG